MKKGKFYQVLAFLSFALVVMAVSPVAAQEGLPNHESPELTPLPDMDLREEKPLLYDPEGKPSNSIQRESQNPVAKPKAKVSDSGNTKPGAKGDDALSFNFLYYIIQKFKISDIVEQ